MGRPYKNKALGEFFDGLRFTSRKQKDKQLRAVRRLRSMIQRDRQYPFDFVYFRVTGFRSSHQTPGLLVPGVELAHDLRVFESRLEHQLAAEVDQAGERVYTAEELCRRFGICRRTLQRWRRLGLEGRLYRFGGRHRKVGFAASVVERFVAEHGDVVQRAGEFSKLSEQEKKRLIDEVRRLGRQRSGSPSAVMAEVARRTGRARETIRMLVRRHDEQHPEAPVFSVRPRLSSKEQGLIYRLYRQGVSVRELMARFDRSRSSLYRIINRQRARDLLARKITYVDSDEFLDEDAARRILSEPIPAKRADSDPWLRREEEIALFRRYNFLKYLACLERTQVNAAQPSGRRLRRVEAYLSEAASLQQRLVEANLGLVVSVAGKHLQTGASLAELVSEGNVALMRAVEKFDYTRGYRFSTYATWVITKEFARRIPAEAGRPDRGAAVDMSRIPRNLRLGDPVDFQAIERARHSLDCVIADNLDEREQFIVRHHFALGPGPVRRKPQTLKQIGGHLGLSKERVRQIELQALQKLRQCLSPQEFDLLTG